MNRFEFARPTSVADAVTLLSEKHDESVALAGGTDLLSLMKDFVIEPKRLVSLMGIKELGAIEASAKELSIGATATIDALLAAAEANGAAAKWPALFQAAAGIKSPQLRTMGTVGGELLQRPRCWYFRHRIVPNVLSHDANGRDVVTAGDHRYHAIFGNRGAAKFVSPSSLAPALIALSASVDVVGPTGSRTIPVDALYRTPEAMEADGREFTLAPNEIVTRIHVPAVDSSKSATYEVRPRQGLDWPLATASVCITKSGGTMAATIVLGHVAPRPWRADGAAKALAGQGLNAKTIEAAVDAAVAGATPLPRNAYKIDLARVAVRRALTAAAAV